MNVSPPRSRRRFTQPASVTVVPAAAGTSSPQVCVLSTVSSLVPRIREERRLAGRAGLVDEPGLPVLRHVPADLDHHRGQPRHALLLRDEIAHDDLAAARLLGATDDRDLRAVLHGALELLLERALRMIDGDA